MRPGRSLHYRGSARLIKRTVINNNYYGDGGHGSSEDGGLSVVNVVAINAHTSYNNSSTYVNTQPIAAAPVYAQLSVAIEAACCYCYGLAPSGGKLPQKLPHH